MFIYDYKYITVVKYEDVHHVHKNTTVIVHNNRNH